jgi:hypothetical protein
MRCLATLDVEYLARMEDLLELDERDTSISRNPSCASTKSYWDAINREVRVYRQTLGMRPECATSASTSVQSLDRL